MKQLFETKNGRVILDEELSEKMYEIKRLHPEQQKPSDEESAIEWDEIGMAYLFGQLYSHEARFCPEHKSWYTYYNGAWRLDEGAILVSEKLKDFVRLMIVYCGEIEDDSIRKEYTKFVNKMGDRRMRDRILKDATGELRISAAQFDSNPYLINCKNGTYDLRDCSFREPSYDDYITMQTNFDFTVDRSVKCERWEKFISEVTQGDKEKADYLQRALGYSLLGMANEECMFILHGKTTRNGKSTLLNTIQYMLGDYASVTDVGLICRQYGQSRNVEAASPTLARLKGKRFVTMSESDEYGKMDEERIKQFTGGEEITARALYQSAITFLPQFTMWLSCNDLPAVSDDSLFASERIRVIEFNRHFTQSEQDKHLKEELCTPEAMKGIFMWLVRGYIRYKERGLTAPESVLKPMMRYRKDNDIVEQFLEENCERTDDGKISVKDLHLRYKTWAKSQGYGVLSIRKFTSKLESHPEWYDSITVIHGYKTAAGLQFKQII